MRKKLKLIKIDEKTPGKYRVVVKGKACSFERTVDVRVLGKNGTLLLSSSPKGYFLMILLIFQLFQEFISSPKKTTSSLRKPTRKLCSMPLWREETPNQRYTITVFDPLPLEAIIVYQSKRLDSKTVTARLGCITRALPSNLTSPRTGLFRRWTQFGTVVLWPHHFPSCNTLTLINASHAHALLYLLDPTIKMEERFNYTHPIIHRTFCTLHYIKRRFQLDKRTKGQKTARFWLGRLYFWTCYRPSYNQEDMETQRPFM